MSAPYSFTQPIRYYKANDPYYYEVDNIPLRQLEENVLYIKNKVEGPEGQGGNVFLSENSELDLGQIKQLRPKASGGRSVTVNAGKFTSRVNDAYNITKPLMDLVFADGPPTTLTPIPSLMKNWSEADKNLAYVGFVNGVGTGGAPYNVNGLEYTFTFHTSPGGLGGNWGWTGASLDPGTEGSENYPHYATPQDATRWPGHNNFGPLAGSRMSDLIAYGADNTEGEYTALRLPTVHMAFVQKWRGVFRTAVVDFPESQVSIDPFDDDDFYYYAGANKIQLPASQRIDLLVAYSVAIDSSGAAIQDYTADFTNQGTGAVPVVKTLTTPMLGVIRGAGIGLQSSDLNTIATEEGIPDPGAPGTSRILANYNDNDITANLGITGKGGTKVHGSFPSPDDLLNIAPLLALDVASDDFQLVGQAALPLAYIVVRKNSTDITDEDIIDIRPFLRTTEFTYNERAGIAAANPPLSLANPAVGSFQLQDVISQISTSNAAATGGGGTPTQGQALYTDYVMGGLAYGVEGTMLTMNEQSSHSKDPWGQESQAGSLNYGGTNYTFTEFNSSKAFLENVDTNKREAFIQYLYTTRQGDLKVWLSDVNKSYNAANGTYLGLPQGVTGRNIPMYPEWDQPFNTVTQQNAVMVGTNSSVKANWWMWLDGTEETKRRPAYGPPAVVSTDLSNFPENHLDKDIGPRWGSRPMKGFIQGVSKRLEISLPPWVQDYDILVQYVNCSPIGSTVYGDDPNFHQGYGGGLYVNKGPVVMVGQTKKAVFYVNSTAQGLPETNYGGMIHEGIIRDGDSSAAADRATDGAAQSHLWVCYTVFLPQFKSNSWGMYPQNQVYQNQTRLAPKFGFSCYPTVKFTIIGYPHTTFSQNATYSGVANNYTLIQNTQNGNSSELLAPKAPLYGATYIDISNAGSSGDTSQENLY